MYCDTIKMHSCVSSVLFIGTTKSLLSIPRISIITWPISIKFTHFMPSVYTTVHTKFDEIDLVVSKVCILKISRLSLYFYSSLHGFKNLTLSQGKTTFLWIDFLQIWYTNKAHNYIVAYVSTKFGNVYTTFKGIMDNYITTMVQKLQLYLQHKPPMVWPWNFSRGYP